MSTIKLVISDLHLADGDALLDGFGEMQQAALEGLLHAASYAGPLGQAEDVELIINGDCFDFMVIPPYASNGITNAVTALHKLEKIIAAHSPFFEALRSFVSIPGRHVTFIIGNHDVELAFAEVRACIEKAVPGGYGEKRRVAFCPTRFYRPLPDVYIEHGNAYDFWNNITGLWDEQGQPLTLRPEIISLPIGTQYFQRASHSMSIAYPYLDHFDPSMDILRQVALLCLFDPTLVMQTAQRVMEMLSQPRKALANLGPGEEAIPGKLFEHAMLDFAAFQQDMRARHPDWTEPPQAVVQEDEQGVPAEQEETQKEIDVMTEFVALRQALSLPLVEAITAICTPVIYPMGEHVARGMYNVLRRGVPCGAHPTLRFAIAGHTHMMRRNPLSNGAQVYLNTGTWTTRLALPAPEEITTELVQWLRQPDWKNNPLRNRTQVSFVLIQAEEGAPSHVSLCVWQSGKYSNV